MIHQSAHPDDADRDSAGVIPFADDAGVSYNEGADRPVDPVTEAMPTFDVESGAGDGELESKPGAADAGCRGPRLVDRSIAAGSWVVRCCECESVRTTAELGVKVSRARVFSARIMAYCTSCEWMRRHVVERLTPESGAQPGAQPAPDRRGKHGDARRA